MAVTPSNVRVAVTGAVSKGLTSATAPTGTGSALTGFNELGGISEDGVTLALPDAGDATPIKVWQNGATVRTLRATSDDLPTIAFTMVETSKTVIETYFGVTVTGSASEGTFDFKSGTRGYDSYVLDVIDGAELIRYYIPKGIVTSVEEITLANTEAIGYGVTIEMENGGVGKDFNFRTWATALKTP